MIKSILLVAISLCLGGLGHLAGMTPRQAFVVAVFSLSIVGTLFFWDLRLALVFLGSGVLFLSHSLNIEEFIRFASLDVILFLLGMMMVVGAMKEAGVFQWLMTALLSGTRLGGTAVFAFILVMSAVLSALTGEVTSILVMTTVILQLCDTLDADPVPLMVCSVLTTNIGSAATLLGNPIGVLIALRAGLTFEDFLSRALPVSMVILGLTIGLLCLWHRDYIRQLSVRLARRTPDKTLPPVERFDAQKKTSTVVFLALVVLIALHGRLERLFALEPNTLLIILPIIFAGIVIWIRPDRARSYVETEVEWASLLFFMFLFAQAGVIQSSGVAEFLAESLVRHAGGHPRLFFGLTLFSSGLLSGVLDNTVVVASYVPVIKNLHDLHFSLTPLWWCLLFGACFGGNITAVGSTANIVALGLLDKHGGARVDFRQWLKLGAVVALLSMGVAYLAVLFLPGFPS